MTDVSRPVHVGVNLLWLVPGVVGGTEDGTVAMLHALADGIESGAISDLKVTLFGLTALAKAHPRLLSRFDHQLLAIDGRRKAIRVLAETTWLPRQLRHHRVDVVHHAGGVVPLAGAWSSGAAVVLTVHDLQPIVLPEFFSTVKRHYLLRMLPRSVRCADVVVTATQFVGDNVVHKLGLPVDRLRVSPFGRTHYRSSVPSEQARRDVRARYRLPGPFFLYPVITYPHKNHGVLLDAFAALIRGPDGAPHPTGAKVESPVLVLPGGADVAEDDIAAHIERLGIGAQVRRTGRISRADLDVLLAEATALTFPSRYEGFGLPVLEAMSAECPVIAARATALPEVVGDAGLLADPDDPGEWTSAMQQLLADRGLRDELAERGRLRSHDPMFSDERVATSMAEAYRTAVAVSRKGAGRG